MPRDAITLVSVFAVLFAPTSTIAAAQATASASVTELDVASPWISSGAGDLPRQTTVTFGLRRAGTVVFTLTRVAPRCARVGAFRVRGRAGRNRFVFPGRIDRRLLPPGTYRLEAPGPRGRALGTVLVVATGDAPADALRRDECGRKPSAPPGGVRAATFVRSDDDGGGLRPVLIVCLAAAIALLGIAALPETAAPGPRAAELLVGRRPAIAVAGGLALAASFGLYVVSLL